MCVHCCVCALGCRTQIQSMSYTSLHFHFTKTGPKTTISKATYVFCCTKSCINVSQLVPEICPDLEQSAVPEGLSWQREELLHSSCLLPHHQLLGRGSQIQSGDNVGVVAQLGTDGLTVQLLHTVHNQLPLSFCFGFLH